MKVIIYILVAILPCIAILCRNFCGMLIFVYFINDILIMKFTFLINNLLSLLTMVSCKSHVVTKYEELMMELLKYIVIATVTGWPNSSYSSY